MTKLNTTSGSEGLYVPLLNFENRFQLDLKSTFSGVLAMGSSGAGKTSSFKNLALQFLRLGMGGLCMVAKASETDNWVSWAKATGRINDLIVFEPDGPHRFNFIDYEARQQKGKGTGLATNIADIILKLSDVTGSQGKQQDAFWEGEQHKAILNPLDALILAGEELTPQSIKDVVISSPNSMEELDSDNWKEHSICFQTLAKIRKRIEKGELSEDQQYDYTLLESYFLDEHCRLHEKTKSIVRAMFTSFFNQLDRNPNHRLFCTDTTFTPEQCLQGKILLMNLPVREYNKAGEIAQKLMKLMFQRIVERSNKHIKNRLPAFLWADEFSTFFYPHDVDFQSTARESMISTVYLTQNLPFAYVKAGGDSVAETRIKALIGNLSTKFLFAQDCPVTTKFNSELIGSTLQWRTSRNTSSGSETSISQGKQENFDFRVRPEDFLHLRTGGKRNNYLVDAYMTQTGTSFGEDRSTVLKVTFTQKPNLK